MERRILAELFVEDDKAIEMDKGTIDYAKNVIDYQCQECGISTGDMRILDDDDPEDAKASELADKIFNSEENKPTTIFVVVHNLTYNHLTHIEFEAFSDYKKAKVWFDKSVSEAKENNALIKLGIGIISTCGDSIFRIDSSKDSYNKDYESIIIKERKMY